MEKGEGVREKGEREKWTEKVGNNWRKEDEKWWMNKIERLRNRLSGKWEWGEVKEKWEMEKWKEGF